MLKPTRFVLLAGGAVALAAAWAGAVRAGEAGVPDPLAVHKAASPCVCLVRADSSLGVPMGYASGFVLGAGKFVVTDLACVAQPGVERVVFTFEDGSSMTGRQFGMADPATGLVAIALPKPRKGTGGLSLSTTSRVGEGGLPAAVVGWQHAEELHVVTGRLINGVGAADLAGRVGTEAPPDAGTFLTLRSSAAEALATGAPVLDGTGGVAGIMVHIRGIGRTAAVPADALRKALLRAEPKLQTLDALPKPVWPVAFATVAGQPPSPQEFAGAVRAIKSRSRCDACRGTGQVMVKKVVGRRRVGGMIRNIVRKVPRRCGDCGGDGVVCQDGIYDYFARMAEGATRLAADPATKDSVIEAAVNNTGGLLAALSKVGNPYRRRLAEQASKDLGKGRGPFSRGIVLYAQRLESVEHGGREYAFLSPYRSSVRLLVPEEDLNHPLGEPDGKRAVGPGPGDWIVLVGLARRKVSVQGHEPVYVQVFGWEWGPDLGPTPEYLRGSEEPGDHRKPPPHRTGEGEPNFFGL